MVSDFVDEQKKSWHEERLVFEALARQDFTEPFEIVLVENEAFQLQVPSDLQEVCPNLKIVFSKARKSGQLKNHGVRVTSGEYVAILDADCVPCPEWLRSFVEVLRQNPNVSAVSGKTSYGTSSIWERSMSLIDRGYLDMGPSGVTNHLATENALFRRPVIERHPYPNAPSPFVSGYYRWKSMKTAGCQFFFEPRGLVVHAFDGWAFESDMRKHRGYLHMLTHPKIGYSSIPKLLYKNLRKEWLLCRRLGSTYLRWYDWPVVLTSIFVLRFLEISGMLYAVQGKDSLPNTGYR